MHFLKLWVPVAAWAGLIFYLSSLPHLEVTHEPVGNFLTRKAGHLAEYAVLFFLLLRAQNYRRPLRALLLTTLYGASDEWHQSFVPSREPRITDVLFDLTGAIIGLIIWKYYPLLRSRLKP